jgi:hypothetical protein
MAVLIVALVIVVLALALAAFLLLRYRRNLADRRYTPSSAYAPPPLAATSAAQSAVSPPRGDVSALTAERDTLASTLIHLADAVTGDPAQLSQAQKGLSRAGYHVIDPTGQRFDSQHHEALQGRPTNDPALDMIIADTARLGYRRDDRVVRQPAVVVYRYQTPEGSRS